MRLNILVTLFFVTILHAVCFGSLRPYNGYGTGNGSGVHFYFAADIGYSGGSGTYNGASVSGGGLMYGGELGVKIGMPAGKNENNIKLLSIALKATEADYPVHTLSMYSLPISYASLGTGRNGGGRGFYWQAGVTVNRVTSANDEKKIAVALYNKILPEATLSVGLNTPFRIVNRRNGNDEGGGRAMIGPAMTYSVMNMLLNSGTMHGFTIGLKCQYLFGL